MRLLTICPSNRPVELQRMLESFHSTKRGKSEIVVYPNNSRPLVEVINGAIKEYPGFDYYQEINDDHVYITQGWDIKLIASIDRIGFAWGDDGWGDKSEPGLPSGVVMSANMVEALGYFFPPVLRQAFCDNALLDIGRETKTMFYNPEVLIEHRHCIYKKAPIDDNYRAVMSKESMAYGKRAYELWAATQKAQDIERLNNAKAAYNLSVKNKA
jgi:hypothetical protein